MAQGEGNGSKGNRKAATRATITQNAVQNGIELKFNGEISGEMKAKLRAVGFRQSKFSDMWYATKSDETSSFAKQVIEFLPDTTSGPPLNLSPSFDPVKPNIERREFSYITISLKDGQDKSFLLFEPSKPKAEVIAFDFARKEFGNQFLELVVKPRQNIREARLLFEEGKIILPKIQDKSRSTAEHSQPSLESKTSDDEPYSIIYKRLLQVIPDLVDHLKRGTKSGMSALNTKGTNELHFDFVHKEKNDSYLIKLGHYESDGNRIAEIRVIPEMKTAEVLTYRDVYEYSDVYEEIDGKTQVNISLKKRLNSFLKQWLKRLIELGHRINLTPTEEDDTSSKGSENNEFSNGSEENNSASNEDATDYKSGYSDKNSIPIPNSNDPLESAHWRGNDKKPGAVIDGIEYDLARLREILLNRLSKLPIEAQLEIVEKLKKRFKERRPLEDYLNSNLAKARKSEKEKKATAIGYYVDDIVIDNDLFTHSGYAVLNYLIHLLFHQADPNQDIEPWTMAKSEFLAYVTDYVSEFKDYPVEVMEMYDILARLSPEAEKLLNEKKPSLETQEKIARLAHLLHIYRASASGLELPAILTNDYPWFQVKALSKTSKTREWIAYGFDATDFKASEKFLMLLHAIGVSANYKKCSYLNDSTGAPPAYLWPGKDIRLVTANNPLLMKGYASFLGIEGAKEQVAKAVQYIETHTTSKGEEGLNYINFHNLFCIDPDDPFSGPYGKDPSPVITIPGRNASSEDNELYARILKSYETSVDDLIWQFNLDPSTRENLLSVVVSQINQNPEWLKATHLKKMDRVPNPIHYGFVFVHFKSTKNFIGFLNSVDINVQHRECRYSSLHESKPKYFWEGSDIRIVTDRNPLTSEGEARMVGIEGTKDKISKAVAFITANAIYEHGGEQFGKTDFEKLLCLDRDYTSSRQTEENVPPGDVSVQNPQLEKTTDSHKEITSSSNGTTYFKPRHKFSAVTEIDRSLIATKPEIFQGRETDFAQETVDKIVREGFDKSQEPIVVWKDEDGKLVVISGHSRWEASRRLYEAGDKSLQIMPVKIYQGTLAEAMDFALLESNRGVTQEGLKSDLRAYKYATQKGYNREYFKGIFKPESRLKLLEDISHLNEAGSFLTYIDTESEKSFPYLQRNAHWVGQIRKQFPILTNNHEEEMFKYLYGLNDPSKKSAGKKLIITKGHFFELIEKKISRIDFEAEKPLKLDQIVSANALTDPAKERIREIDKEIDKLEQERHQKDELIARATKEGKSALVEKFRNRQSEINQIITRMILEKEKIEGEIGILERTAIDLFTASETSVVVPENPTESHTLIKEADINRNFQPAQEHKQDAITEAHIPAQTDHDVQDRNKNTKTPEDYIDRIVAIMHDKYDRSERATRKTIENIGVELGISDSGKVWEAVELSWLLWYQMLYKQSISFDARLSQMVRFWDKVQPTYEYSDSSKEIYKQYSTPCPISAIVAQYTGMDKTRTVFDPSAGNGLLVLGADAVNTYVNEIDSTRIESLKFQSFKSITTFNATQPFPEEYTKAFDIVVTNPPFTKWEDVQFDKEILIQKIFDNHIGLNHHLRLEHVMCGIALHCMKDTGRAALIIMNHIYFDDNGYIAKYRPFFNWLYRHYFVDDVINLNSYKLYNKQGAIQKTMLILINGRKSTPFGVGPRKEDAPHFDQMVNSFEELWKRVSRHMLIKVYSGDEVWNYSTRVGSEHNDSLQLEMDREKVRGNKYYKIPLSISQIRESDTGLDTIIQQRLGDFKPGRKIAYPIIIGEVRRGDPPFHNGVLDGTNRVIQAIANGDSVIEAYVPVDNKEYVTKHHNGYSIEKVIQQLILATTV